MPPHAPSGLRLPEDTSADSALAVQRLLRATREHLELDVAFVSEFSDGRRVFRYVDAAEEAGVIAVGEGDPLEASYCHYVVRGDVPQFLADPMGHPVTAALEVTRALPVGTHLSVPISFSDGRLFGTLCCFGLDVRDDLQARDLHVLEMVAELAGEYLEALDIAQRETTERRSVIEGVLADPDGLAMLFQPLRNLATMDLVGAEALARFPGRHQRPDWFFAEAARAGLGLELEMRAVRQAFAALPDIPAPVPLSVNVSPDTLYSEEFLEVAAAMPGDRLVIEVTEHAAIEDYAQLQQASARLTELGIRLAIDDVGMGFSGLNRILESSPEELKLDAAVIRNVHDAPVKQALIEMFCSFGARVGFEIVAEGIETEDELHALRTLGVPTGQGYLLGRPGPVDRLTGP